MNTVRFGSPANGPTPNRRMRTDPSGAWIRWMQRELPTRIAIGRANGNGFLVSICEIDRISRGRQLPTV